MRRSLWLVLLLVAAEDAVMVERVDADFAAGVQDLLIFQQQAHTCTMRPSALSKKARVTGPGLGHEVHRLAHMNLLVGVAGELYAYQTVKLLHEARAINTEQGFASPEVRRFQVHEGPFSGADAGGHPLLPGGPWPLRGLVAAPL